MGECLIYRLWIRRRSNRKLSLINLLGFPECKRRKSQQKAIIHRRFRAFKRGSDAIINRDDGIVRLCLFERLGC